MILLLDNYDSFTWNLYHYVEQFTDEHIEVRRNDEVDIDDVQRYSSVILSPGPGLPADAGITIEVIKRYGQEIPILGVCLGHQAIGEAFGGRLINLKKVVHGVQRKVSVIDESDRLMKNLPSKFYSGHYHSWVISKEEFPEELIVTAEDQSNNIMAISHKRYPISGVQFHPESIMTEHGITIIRNWLKYCHNLQRNKIFP